MKILKPCFLGVFLVLLFLGAAPVKADHIPENLFEEVFREANTPVCLTSNEIEGTSIDCAILDQAVFACWKERLHLNYDQESLLDFLEEIKATNQKYAYYYEPYYNEFFSNRNWDNLMNYSDRC